IKFHRPSHKALRVPIQHRAVFEQDGVGCRVSGTLRRKIGTRLPALGHSSFVIRHSSFPLASLLLWAFALNGFSATVVGTFRDISIQGLDTKLMFAPTNEVLVTGTGLSAGAPKVIDSVSGAFSIALEAGDYTVSLPLIPWRKPFVIS